jgi:hypothetical protein
MMRLSGEIAGDFELTEEEFCCPDFRVTGGALYSICRLPN